MFGLLEGREVHEAVQGSAKEAPISAKTSYTQMILNQPAWDQWVRNTGERELRILHTLCLPTPNEFPKLQQMGIDKVIVDQKVQLPEPAKFIQLAPSFTDEFWKPLTGRTDCSKPNLSNLPTGAR